jgi:hypothetical protein
MKNSAPHKLAVCAIFRNEAPYLTEWLDFHRAQGVSQFFLFDDRSTDDFRQVLEPWVQEGIVVVCAAPIEPDMTVRQELAYQSGLGMAKGSCEWLAFIDIDEFLFSPLGLIHSQLPTNPFVAGVFVWWRVFGSAGNKVPPAAGVTRAYTRAAPWPSDLAETQELRRLGEKGFFPGRSKRPIHGRLIQGKCIVRPRMIAQIKNHFPGRYWGVMVNDEGRTLFRRNSRYLINGFPPPGTVKGKYMTEVPTIRKLRINHYWSKSLFELQQKATKWAYVKTNAIFADYVAWDRVLNAEEDLTILQKQSE